MPTRLFLALIGSVPFPQPTRRPPLALIQLLRVSVHPRGVQSYERLVRYIAGRAREDAHTFGWSTRQVNGVEGQQYAFIAPAEGYAELAAREPIDAMVRRLLGEGDGNAILDALAEGIESQSFSVLSPREDLSNAPPPLAAPPQLVHHTRIRVRPGGQAALEATVGKVLEATVKIGDKRQFLTTQTVIGDLGEYGIVQPIADPAQLDSQLTPQQLLAEAFGEKEAGDIMAAGRERMESVVTSERTLKTSRIGR